jgi:Heme/copper-type cytochrome/quinol oxidases, subunit 1
MFTTGQVSNDYFSLTSTALAVPAGLEYVAAIGTLIGGAIVLRTPMLFAIGFFVQFLLGGLSGIYVASPPLDYHVHDSYVVVAHFHYTLLAGSVFGLFAAVYFWWPKVTGYLLREGLGKVHFWIFVVGTNLTFLPQFVPRLRRDAAAGGELLAVGGLDDAQPAVDAGLVHRRGVGARVPRERRRVVAGAAAGGA